MEARAAVTQEDGFTIIEVLLAASLLVTGLLAMFTMLDTSQAALQSTRGKEAATALQRELVETTQGIPYDQVTPASTPNIVAAAPGLADASHSQAGWTVRRRGFTYTVSLGSCTVDDPRDGIGRHDAGVFCASGAGNASPSTCSQFFSVSGQLTTGIAAANATAQMGDCGLDLNADGVVDGLIDAVGTVCVGTCGGSSYDQVPGDYKRVVSLVTWMDGNRLRRVLQTTTLANPGLSATPTVTSLTAGQALPVTSSATTTLTFTAGASATPAAVAWYLDGTQKGTASASGASWTFSWPLGTVSGGAAPGADEVTDGTYLVGVRAFDSDAQPGPLRSLTVVLNRRAPFAPAGVGAGFDGSDVVVEWSPPVERDIAGYRVYRNSGAGWTEACALTTATSCRDTAAPALGAQYRVVAVDRDAANALREGTPSATVTVVPGNHAPNPPTGLQATSISGGVQLTWSAPAVADVDPGDSIDHYVIYRDGTAYADRYDRTGDPSLLTYTDTQTGGVAHTYWVAAVDGQLASSSLVGPVTQ